MRRCLRNKIVSLSLVGLGGFLIGGALGVALGSKDDECEEGSEIDKGYIPTPLDYESEHIEYSEEGPEKRTMMVERYDVETGKFESMTLDEANKIIKNERYYEDDDIEIIDYTVRLTEEGIEIKNTTEGLIEVVDPYIISEDEFMDPNVFTEFDRGTLLYYEKDDTLATDRDEVITDVENTVGSSALTNFGHLSNNKDVVFVRNVKLGMNFEIIREEGSFKETVLGISDEDIEYEKARKFFKKIEDEERE